jgi:hypothetical protein
LGHRRVSRNTDERTVISCILPWGPASYGWILSLGPDAKTLCILCGVYNSFIFDYLLRNSLSQPSIPQGTFQQTAIIEPNKINEKFREYIIIRVLELTYTAWDLQDFAIDCGYEGPPFIWDEERRFLMRCELDAAYFHLYGISAQDVDYIMDTFPIVKRKDQTKYGSYRTKEKILEIYEKMSAAIASEKVYETVLSPPPADPSVAHPGEQT